MTWERQRRRMVRDQLEARGIRDAAVLEAMAAVPRQEFIPDSRRPFAYDDGPLPIGLDQTISQPYIVACMAEQLRLRPGDRVLDVGTGSGYAAAVLGQVAAEVYSVERLEPLAVRARETLRRLGYDNIHVLHADGTLGWPEAAPYDAIHVAAAAGSVPAALPGQLADGGRLVVPVGATPFHQRLLRITHEGAGRLTEEEIAAVRFVPLLPGTGMD